MPACANSTITRNDGTEITYTYDPLNRLTAADYNNGQYFQYTYDAVGNRQQENRLVDTQSPEVVNTFTYDDANRLTGVNGVSYTWDANGNLLSDGASTYSYDHANRLMGVTQGSAVYGFAYLGSGDRIGQTVNGVTTTYALDLNAGLTQVLQDGTNTYLYGNERIGQFTTSESAYFLGDALGSVRQLTDAGGAVILTRAYEPYGEVMNNLGSGSSVYGFTNEYTDETGLVYLRARYFDTVNGRFLSQDRWKGEIDRPISYNKWLYGNSNPILYVDPSGMISVNEDKLAQRVVTYLEDNYHILITIDWGYMTIPIPHPEPGGSSNNGCWERGLWSLGDLNIIRYSVEEFSRKFASMSQFTQNFGLIRMAKGPYACGRGCTYGTNKIIFLSQGKPAPVQVEKGIIMNQRIDFDAWTVIHEMGHFWDHRNSGRLSKGLEEFTGGSTNWFSQFSTDCDVNNRKPGCNDAGYFYGGIPPKGSDSGFNRQEDFAESVAAYIFPVAAQAEVERLFRNTIYEDLLYYKDYKETARFQYVDELIRR